MRKNRLIALIGTLTMAAAGLAAVSAGVSSKKAESVNATYGNRIYVNFDSCSFASNAFLHYWGGTGGTEWHGEQLNTSNYINVTNEDRSEGDKLYYWNVGNNTSAILLNWDIEHNTEWNRWGDISFTGNKNFVKPNEWQSDKFSTYTVYKATLHYNNNTTVTEYSVAEWAKYAAPASDTGWYTDSGCTTPYTKKNLTADIDLYEKAPAADTYSVVYHSNNGASLTVTKTYETTEDTTAIAKPSEFANPERERFNGWALSESSTYSDYYPGDPINARAKDTVLNLYAVYDNAFYIRNFTQGWDSEFIWNSTLNQFEGTIDLEEGDEFKIVQYTDKTTISSYYANIQSGDAHPESAINHDQMSGGGSDPAYAPNIKAEVAGNYSVYMKDSDCKIYIPYNHFSVTYHANGGTVGSVPDGQEDQVGCGKTEIVRAANTYGAPTGKLFRGWNTNAEGTGTTYNPNAEISLAKNGSLDLYAIFTNKNPADGYYVEGVFNGTSATRFPMSKNGEKDEYTITSPSLVAGNYFKFSKYQDENLTNWYGTDQDKLDGDVDSALKVGQLTEDGEHNYVVVVPGSYTGYLEPNASGKKIWISAIKYHISYNYNVAGSSVDPIVEDFNVGTGTTAKANPFTKPDHASFGGWATSPTGGVAYAAGASIASQAQDSTLQLYAIWNYESQVTVNYYNENSELVDSLVGYSGASLTAPAVPSKEGYKGSWSETLTVFPATNTNVFASYEAEDYTVTLVPGDDASVSPTSISVTYDQAYGPLPTPTKNGYSFDGWFDLATGGNEVTSATIYQISDDSSLYAHWTKENYSITYMTNGGTLDGTQAISFNIDSSDINLPTASNFTETPDSSTFGGWYDNPSFEGSPITKIAAGSYGNKTVYAKWVGLVTVTYTADGETVDTITGVPGTTIAEADIPDVPEKKGHSIVGWDQNLTSIPSTDTEVKAVYSVNKYTITWVTDGDELTGNYTSGSVDYGTAIVAPNTPTKTGYTFAAWSDSIPETMPAHNVTLTATWTVNKHTLAWDADGGELSGSYTSGSVEYGTEIVAPTVTKTGYTFDKWEPTVPETMPDDNLSIKAKWIENSVTVNFHGGTDVSGSMSAQTIKYSDSSKALNANAFSKIGHSFAGWATSEGGEVVYEDQANISEDFTQTTKTIDLYAVWDVNQIKITFENTDERGGSVQLTRDYGTEMTFNDLASFGITDLTEDPLGRTYVGLKTDPKASEVSKTITFDGSVDKYYICYAFDDASAYQYSFDGVTYFPFAAHRDAQEGEAYTLQDYYVQIAKVTAGDTLYVKYDDKVVKLSPDGNSNISLGGKVNNTAENVYLDLRLIYKDGTYSYMPVLGGMPQNQFCVSVDGVLTPLEFDGSWQQVKMNVAIEEGQTVDAYFNSYYACSLNDAVSEEFFKVVDGHIVCQKTGTYDVYLQNTGENQYNRFYFGLTPQFEAELYAQNFVDSLKETCEACEDINKYNLDDKTAELNALSAKWTEQAALYNNLSSAAKEILVNAEPIQGDEPIKNFAWLYCFTYNKYQQILGTDSPITKFIDRDTTISSASRKMFSISDVSSSTWIIASVAIVAIAAVGVFFIYRKRKEN